MQNPNISLLTEAKNLSGIPEIIILILIGFVIFLPAVLIFAKVKKIRGNKINELQRLNKLRSQGAISEEEYEKLRQKISI